jgi:autotransporter-associated beta strand protein
MTLTGNITLNAGTIRLAANDAVHANSTVTIASGATLDDSYGNGEGLEMLGGTGTFLGRQGANLNIGENNSNGATFSGKITAGTNGVVGAAAAQRQLLVKKTGTGVATLAGTTSDFAGQVQVLLGTLAVGQINNRGTPGSLGLGDANSLGGDLGANPGADIAIGDAATATTTADLAVFRYSGGGGSAATDRNFAFAGDGGSIEVANAATNFRINGVLSGSGKLLKTGPGTLTIGASPTMTGSINITAGKLEMDTGAGELTLSQLVNGPGQFVKKGTGTLLLASGIDTIGGTLPVVVRGHDPSLVDGGARRRQHAAYFRGRDVGQLLRQRRAIRRAHRRRHLHGQGWLGPEPGGDKSDLHVRRQDHGGAQRRGRRGRGRPRAAVPAQDRLGQAHADEQRQRLPHVSLAAERHDQHLELGDARHAERARRWVQHGIANK